MKKLNVGSGTTKLDGFINVDYYEHENVDYQVDLNWEPLPFDDNTFDEVHSYHALEHLRPGKDGFLWCTEEMYRVSKPNAKWHIVTPYYTTSHDNPFHINNTFSEHTFYFFSLEGCKYLETRARKDTANEDIRTTLHIDEINYVYYDEYKSLRHVLDHEAYKVRHSKPNVVKEIIYDMTVVK